MLLLLAAAPAFAAEPVPTLAMPTAVALEAGTGQAGVGALAVGGDSPSGAVTLRGAVGITDRLAISGGLMEPRGGLLLGLRYNVYQSDTFRVAPFVFGIADDDLVTEAPIDTLGALSAGLGVALEGGGQTFRFDLSLPLVATGIDPLANPLYVPLVGGSLGVTVQAHRRHALRFGIESLAAPAVTWRYAADRWYLQATGLYSLVRAQPMIAAEVGLRF
ncbi:MAG: hypothetical protein Q8P41_16140 [Pseudomonadota bacterium]|nr:hypothetical protein [Pseudomonadota bacterium]